MNTSIDFAHCLKYLLSSLGISINRLSKALNVDGSLVNRWVNGKRIPAYKSNYIETIAQFLSENIKNSLQIQLINELFERVFSDGSEEGCSEEKIKKILFEAQGISLNNHKKQHKESQKMLKYRKARSHPSHFDEVVSLSDGDKIISGVHNVASAFRHLLSLALLTPPKRQKAIYITHLNDIFFYISTEEDRQQVQTLLLDLMARGYEVHCLLRISHDSRRRMECLNFFRSLIGTNRLHVHYLKSYDSLALGKDDLIVPEIGVLSSLLTQSDQGCALYLRTQPAISFYEDHWVRLAQSSAMPLLTNYSAEKDACFRKFCLENDDAIGNRYLCRNNFSTSTLPLHLYKKLLLKRNASKQEMASAIDFYQKRQEAFQSNIKNYVYKDIYTVECMRHLVKNRRFFFYDHIGYSTVDLEIDELIDFLQNIIDLLKTYDNYSIAFVRKNNLAHEFERDISCLVKERHTVIVEILGTTHTAPVRFSISEPMMINTVEEYFERLWQQIAPIMKKKADVITWLQQEIDMLKSTLYLKSDS